MFPMNGLPFTPTSECPHHCKRCGGVPNALVPCGLCEGSGSFVDRNGDYFDDCPECESSGRTRCNACLGSGKGPIPKGSRFVCMVCHQGGKDGHKALPLDVARLPDDPQLALPAPTPKAPESAPLPTLNRKQRRAKARGAAC